MQRSLFQDFEEFLSSLYLYFHKRAYQFFRHFEQFKCWLASGLYKQRGRWGKPFEHLSFSGLIILAVLLAPVIGSYSEATISGGVPVVLGVATKATTSISEKPRDGIVIYKVQTGDTVSVIAQKFGVSTDTIRWANNLKTLKSIKTGQELKILPVTGIAHKVKRGETVWSIAKRYSTGSQGIVDFPFNTFVDDEKFTLAVGQLLIVPDGVMPKVKPWQPKVYIAQKTPNAGTVTATGIFVWPTSGRITQRYHWYHRAIDIANRAAPSILAADSGRIIVAGWPGGWGYGNRIIIDHGNGFRTLYAHLSRIYVKVGQTVKRGDLIGQMGSTGRSTGTHLHFEIRKNGRKMNPLNYLK